MLEEVLARRMPAEAVEVKVEVENAVSMWLLGLGVVGELCNHNSKRFSVSRSLIYTRRVSNTHKECFCSRQEHWEFTRCHYGHTDARQPIPSEGT